MDIPEAEAYPIFAVDDGFVSSTGNYQTGGLYVRVGHDHPVRTLITEYIHLSAISVKAPQEVKRGDKLGEMGLTGLLSGGHTHLHFNVHFGQDQFANPHDFWIDYDGGGPPIVIAPFVPGKDYKTSDGSRTPFPASEADVITGPLQSHGGR